MTAINVIKQYTSVSVITDGAGYRADGVLAFRVQKVFPLAHLNAVIATRGSPLFAPMFAYHASIRATEFDDLKRLAPEIAKEESSKASAAQPDTDSEFDLFIAGWSETSGPSGYVLCNHARHGIQPWQAIDLGPINLSPHSEAIKAELDLAYPKGVAADDFDPVFDGLRGLEIQRKHPVEHHWEKHGLRAHAAVGAFAQLTTVTAEAITTKILRRWPDEIGEPLASHC